MLFKNRQSSVSLAIALLDSLSSSTRGDHRNRASSELSFVLNKYFFLKFLKRSSSDELNFLFSSSIVRRRTDKRFGVVIVTS